MKFDGNILNKKVSVGLNWDLSKCDDSIMKNDNMQQSFSNSNPMIITIFEHKRYLCGCITYSKETDNSKVITEKTYIYEKIIE